MSSCSLVISAFRRLICVSAPMTISDPATISIMETATAATAAKADSGNRRFSFSVDPFRGSNHKECRFFTVSTVCDGSFLRFSPVFRTVSSAVCFLTAGSSACASALS